MLITCPFEQGIIQWILCYSFSVASLSFDLKVNVTPCILQDLGRGFLFVSPVISKGINLEINQVYDQFAHYASFNLIYNKYSLKKKKVLWNASEVISRQM